MSRKDGRQYRRTLQRLILTIACGVAMLIYLPGVANAASAGEPQPSSYVLYRGASVGSSSGGEDKNVASPAAVPAPCVTAALDPPGIVSQTVHVKNACAAQQRTKVIVAWAFDSPCFILEPGGRADYRMDISAGGYFDGLEAC